MGIIPEINGEIVMDKKNKIFFNSKLKKVIVYFVIFMIAFTGVSKAMYNMTITNVTVKTIAPGSINKKITGTGVVESTLDIPIYVKEGLYVNQIYVSKGDKVKKGDDLFQVDVTKVDKLISTKNDELTKINLDIQDESSAQEYDNRSKNLQISQANEKYSRTSEKYDEDIADALAEYEAAKKAYDEYVERSQVATSTDAESVKVIIDNLNKAKEKYDQLIEAKDNELFTIGQEVDSANLGSAKKSTAEALQLQYKVVKEELDELNKLKASGGKIKAEMDGQIKDIKLMVGEATNSNAAIMISKTDNTLLVRSEFPIKYKNDIKEGNSINIKSDNINTTLTADRVHQEADKGVIVVYSELSGEQVVIGESCDVQLVTKSVSYDMVVPLEALNKNANNQYCVYIYEVYNTITGSETRAKEVVVEVLDRDNSNVAIAGDGLSMGVEIIVNSSRVIGNESKVKIVEK